VIFVTRHKIKAKNKYERKGASRLEDGGLKGFQTAYVSKYVWAKCI
jgi:hypothetical protein